MKSPMTGQELIPMRETRTFTFRKDEFTIMYHFLREPDGSDQYTTTELDEVNINQLYNQYRDKYNLPFPDEIKAIRDKYELSAIKMSEVLGFGANVWRNYEAGEVPSESNARLIQVANDEVEFRKLVKLSTHLDEKAKNKIMARIEGLLKANDGWRTVYGEEDYVMGTDPGDTLPDHTTGYRKPNLERLTEMIVYFTEAMRPWKTKLNKLLFYADFRHFQLHGFSISGARYRAVTHGPVPKQYDALFDHVARREEVMMVQEMFASGDLGTQFLPKSGRSFRKELFDETELATLDEVAKRFKMDTARQIIEASHEEDAWKQFQKEHAIIDYNLAFGLKAFDEQDKS